MGSPILYADARCALGGDLENAVDALLAGQRNLCHRQFSHLEDPVTLPFFAMAGDCGQHLGEAERVYRYLEEMVERALVSHNLSHRQRQRTGVFLGSSSFDVCVSEEHYQAQLKSGQDAIPMSIVGYGKLAQRLQTLFGLGPHAYSYSTACTSSANGVLNAHRLLQAGHIDYALVIGIELFNQTTLLGFHGLGLISPSATMAPFERNRDGLVLGETCSLILMSRDEESPVSVSGGAIATDNHSLTAANTDGSTIAAVMQQALWRCGLVPEQLCGIKTHGTASLLNDEAEAAGIRRLQQSPPPLFALKPYVGHTLGACGALETALTYGCLLRSQLPANPLATSEEDLGVKLQRENREAADGYYGLNFFAFGGNNCTLLLCKGNS